MIGIASRLAHMSGWAEEQVVALRTGTPTSDAKIDVLTGLVREAAANSGNVTDATWKAAQLKAEAPEIDIFYDDTRLLRGDTISFTLQLRLVAMTWIIEEPAFLKA
jgi:hypothetical protein